MISGEATAYLTAAREEACSFLGMTIPDRVWEDSIPRALQKLDRIINRYGDDGGERMKPYYLGKLVEEDIRERAFSEYTMTMYRELQVNKKRKEPPPFGDDPKQYTKIIHRKRQQCQCCDGVRRNRI